MVMCSMDADGTEFSVSMRDGFGDYLCICSLLHDVRANRMHVKIESFNFFGRPVPDHLVAWNGKFILASLLPQPTMMLRSYVAQFLRRLPGSERHTVGAALMTRAEAQRAAGLSIEQGSILVMPDSQFELASSKGQAVSTAGTGGSIDELELVRESP